MLISDTLRGLAFGALALLAGCAGGPTKQEDPLIERIVRGADGQQLDREELLAAMVEADVIYLGETHENPRHHEIQRELIDELIRRGRAPAIGFEFFSQEQTSLLMQHVAPEGRGDHGRRYSVDEVKLRERLGWQKRDRDWGFYYPLVHIAREHRLPVFGADLDEALRLRLAREGVEGLEPVEAALLEPTGFDDPAYKALMFEQLTAAHCGWRHEPVLERLYATWIARNDAMARAIARTLAARPEQPVVLIVGAGHIQHDMGVFERVAHLRPGVRQLNLGIRPVAIESRPLADYIAPEEIAGQRFAPAHAYFWFTGRVSYENPCDRFATQLKRE